MRTLLRILLLIAATAGVPLSIGAADPVQAPAGFIEPIIRITTGATSGFAEVNLKSARVQPTAPSVEDIPLSITGTVKFFPVEASGNTPSNTWRYRVDVAGIGTAGITQQRFAKVTYADQTTETVPYTVTNQAATPFTWNIAKPPDPWASSLLPWGPSCTSFTVTPKDSVATAVQVTAALVEEVSKKAITSNKLWLCKGLEPCTGVEPIELPPNVPSQLSLCTTETFHGSFTGSINLIAREKPEGEIILQRGEFSSFAAKLVGFIVIVLGVFIAWLAKVYARARLERDQALLPAIEMRVQLESLQTKLESIQDKYSELCTNIKRQITDLLAELSTESLDRQRLIPPAIPNPFVAAPDNAAYKQFLESKNPTIQVLAILIKDGVMRAAAKDTGLPPEKVELVKGAVRDIDAIANASPLPTPNAASTQVATRIATLETALSAADTPQAEPERTIPAAQELKTVNLEIETISKGVWLVYALLTALTGLAVLILSNPGFGTPLDFVFAFFWGFALPTTVQSLSPGSAATALGISIAKA